MSQRKPSRDPRLTGHASLSHPLPRYRPEEAKNLLGEAPAPPLFTGTQDTLSSLSRPCCPLVCYLSSVGCSWPKGDPQACPQPVHWFGGPMTLAQRVIDGSLHSSCPLPRAWAGHSSCGGKMNWACPGGLQEAGLGAPG